MNDRQIIGRLLLIGVLVFALVFLIPMAIGIATGEFSIGSGVAAALLGLVGILPFALAILFLPACVILFVVLRSRKTGSANEYVQDRE